MPMLKIEIKTVSPISNLISTNETIFATKNNTIYFINPRKLDKILSLLQLLGEFNEYCYISNDKNITNWLKQKKLLSDEILNEISFKEIPCNKGNTLPHVFCFCPNNTNISKYLELILKENISNIMLSFYLQSNYQKINDSMKHLLDFFNKHKEITLEREKSLNFFLNCFLEPEIYKFNNQNIDVICKTPNNIMTIEKIINSHEQTYKECIQANQIINFDINYSSTSDFFKYIDKYLNELEYINFLRIQQETKIISQKTDIKITPEKSNMSFLNRNQIIYLNLTEENQKNLNDFMNMNIATNIFSFVEKKYNRPDFINYALMKIK